MHTREKTFFALTRALVFEFRALFTLASTGRRAANAATGANTHGRAPSATPSATSPVAMPPELDGVGAGATALGAGAGTGTGAGATDKSRSRERVSTPCKGQRQRGRDCVEIQKMECLFQRGTAVYDNVKHEYMHSLYAYSSI